MLEVLKRKDGRTKAQLARWAAFRAAQRATLPAEEVERKKRLRKSQAKWLASLTPEQIKHRMKGKRDRQRERNRRKAKAAKAAKAAE